MKNEDLHLVRAITARIECFHCKGKGRVPGGEIKYGEVVDCPVCNGRGTTPVDITIEQLKRLVLWDAHDLHRP